MNAFCEHHKDSVRFGYRCFDRTEARSGWHHIDAGPHLEILFHPNRRLAGREPDQIERPSIVIAVAGKREQGAAFRPLQHGCALPHPTGPRRADPLPVAEGQTPLEATLAFFEKPLRFRGLLALAEEDEVASQLRDEELRNAASQIRARSATAHKGGVVPPWSRPRSAGGLIATSSS